jgi:hypothetical protein
LRIIYQAFYVYLHLLDSSQGTDKVAPPLPHHDPGIQHEPFFK